MDAKFKRRFQSFCNSLNALAEAKQRDLSDLLYQFKDTVKGLDLDQEEV